MQIEGISNVEEFQNLALEYFAFKDINIDVVLFYLAVKLHLSALEDITSVSIQFRNSILCRLLCQYLEVYQECFTYISKM